MRPLIIVRTPAMIISGTILSTLSFQGSVSTLITRQRQIFNEYPGSEQTFHEVLDEVTKDDKGKGGDGSSGKKS